MHVSSSDEACLSLPSQSTTFPDKRWVQAVQVRGVWWGPGHGTHRASLSCCAVAVAQSARKEVRSLRQNSSASACLRPGNDACMPGGRGGTRSRCCP